MDIKKMFNKKSLVRSALFVAAIAVILLIMPRPDHQSYSYEVNQPWKYPLLTAEFDVPMLRDSVTAAALRDSINARFMPFVKRDDAKAGQNIKRFVESVKDSVPIQQVSLLTGILSDIYERGIMEESLNKQLDKGRIDRVRVVGDDPTLIESIHAGGMLSEMEAYAIVDSAYNAVATAKPAKKAAGANQQGMSHFLATAVRNAIVPNVLVDSITDEKFRSQELLEVSAAFGVIKKGQRIVDRGEIVTPQIYTNLNTYMAMLAEIEEQNSGHTYYSIGQGIIFIAIFGLFYIFLFLYRYDVYSSIRKMTFLMTYLTLFMVVSVLLFEFVNKGLYLMPFAAVPVVILVFFDSRTAIFSLVVSVLIASLIATFPHQFILMELIAGLSATYCIAQLTKRSQLLLTAIVTFFAYNLTYFALVLLRDGNLDGYDVTLPAYFAVNSFILSFTYVMILVVEKIFGFTSTVTLVELSDINNSLLRRLAEEAPGTFQHSMQVSTLAAEAANAIKANTQLVRTGALYHDIGKLEGPVFYTENQHGVNPHMGLDPETSARKIISHVTRGVSLAHKNKLPAVIRDFILEHHGRGVTKYFYNTAMNVNNGEGVDITKFQYPGPNPQSKESVLLMMADAVEAASRSLTEYTQENINNLVDKIIGGQIADGLYRESPISFKDIEKVKETFKKRLATIYHTRIAYPELKKAQDKTVAKSQ